MKSPRKSATPAAPLRTGAATLTAAVCVLLGALAAGLFVPPSQAAGEGVQLEFVYGSEKQKWLEAVTAEFLKTKPMVNGMPVTVKLVPLGSGETVEEVIEGRRQPHLISPASEAYLVLGNARAKGKGQEPLIAGDPKYLVFSPVVVAMWKPMAEALGWPDKEIGWKDLHDLAADPDGWKSKGHAEWGPFKFGHTHPEFSNSGLLSVLSEVCAGSGKKKPTVADVEAADTGKFLKELESAVVHYGSSTGFFANTMFSNGPDYLSGAVMYENLVVDSYTDPKIQAKLPFPVVAVYPKEGTFMSDHPVGVVNRPWVTPAHQKAAELYMEFLLDKPQQERALKFGFRPGSGDVAVAAPIDAAHGVDPKKPGAARLFSPDADVMTAGIKAWKENKKHARVILVFDRSESMSWEKGKLENAKAGAQEILKHLGDEDSMGLITFSNILRWVHKGAKLKENRAELEKAIDSIEAKGQTALYDAIAEAHKVLQDGRPGDLTALVVLTDGEDTDSKRKLEELLKTVAVDNKTVTTRIYTIAYGTDADPKVLKRISDATKAKSYIGKKENIVEVIKDIATFF